MAPDGTPPALAGRLEEERAILAAAADAFGQRRWRIAAEIYSTSKAPLLLGAVEAVLKLADGWDAKAKEIGAQIELEDCEGATAGFKMIGHMNHRDHAAKVREAITSALAGKEAGDELAEPAS
jgi:hypothetical protein